MHIGMLWFDNDPRTTLSVKIQKAMEYYSKKFGRTPDLCLVHPSMLKTDKNNLNWESLAFAPIGLLCRAPFGLALRTRNKLRHGGRLRVRVILRQTP